MRSIQSRLWVWLLPTCLFVFGIAGAGFYYATKSSLESELDVRLSRLSGEARFALRNHFRAEESPRRNGPTLRSFLSLPEFQEAGQYFGFRSNQGRVQLHSKNLTGVPLEALYAASVQGQKQELLLPNGDPVRIYSATVYMDSREPAGVFFVGLSRKALLETLRVRFTQVMLGLAASCIVVGLLIFGALRVALRQIQRFSDQVRGLHEHQLNFRFESGSLPAELVPIAEGFNDMISRLEEGFEREKRFNGFLAHELRTPLAGLRLTSEVAAKWPSPSSTQDFEAIASMAAKLQQTLDSLLWLSNLENASTPCAMQPLDLVEFVHELLSEHEATRAEKRLEFRVVAPEPRIVQADPTLLRLVLSNLISNAIAYTLDEQGIEVTLPEGASIFKISNPAPQLSAEDVPRLFERLWRKDANRSESEHAGLGLSISRAAAKAMGYEVEVELDLQGWVHFTVSQKR